MPKEFKEIFRQLMIENNLNQQQMADILGIRQSQVSNLLNGKSNPQYYTIRQICIRLKVSADFVLGLEDLE